MATNMSNKRPQNKTILSDTGLKNKKTRALAHEYGQARKMLNPITGSGNRIKKTVKTYSIFKSKKKAAAHQLNKRPK